MDERRLTQEEQWLWLSWKLAGENVMARVTIDIAEATGLSFGDYAVLTRLYDLGRGYMAQQDLADSMKWDKSRLSHHLTRMEGRGLVRRKPGPRKGVTVHLSATGEKQLMAAWPVHAQSIRRHLLWRLNATQRKALLAMCRLLNDN